MNLSILEKVIVIIILGCCLFFGLRLGNVNQKELYDPNHIQSVDEIQRKLCEAGYIVKIDNIYGAETAKAFDRWYCDKNAEKHFAQIGWNK